MHVFSQRIRGIGTKSRGNQALGVYRRLSVDMRIGELKSIGLAREGWSRFADGRPHSRDQRNWPLIACMFEQHLASFSDERPKALRLKRSIRSCRRWMRSAASARSLRSCSSRSAMVMSRAETAASRSAIRARKSAVEGACSDTQNLYSKALRYGSRIDTKSIRNEQN